jgi:hypothetical protein
MIVGRPASLWITAFAALFNVVVLYHLLGFTPDATQISATNLGFAAVIYLVANVNIQTALNTPPPTHTN